MATLDIFEQLEAEPEFVQTYPEDYDLRRLNQADDGEVYKGNPVLSEVNSFENETDKFDDSGMVIYETAHNVKLALIDDEKELILDIPIKLKSDNPVQKGIHPASSLNKLLTGVVQMKGGDMGENNAFKKVNIDNLRKIIDEIPLMKVKVSEVVSGNFMYNSFAVLDPSKDYDGEELVE